MFILVLAVALTGCSAALSVPDPPGPGTTGKVGGDHRLLRRLHRPPPAEPTLTEWLARRLLLSPGTTRYNPATTYSKRY